MQVPPTAIGRAARAYGVRLQHPAVKQVQPVKEAPKASEIKRGADQLIAGSVRESAEFEVTPASPAKIKNVLQMYSRAADKIEIATKINVGRSLDVSG